ncbi:MAG: hypothetical protein RLO80_04560 [Hyphomonas sp.]
MSIRFFAVALATALGACAGTPDGAQTVAAGDPNAPKECRSYKPPGSNIIKRECKTAVEWAKHDAEEVARNEGLLGNSRESASPNTMIR